MAGAPRPPIVAADVPAEARGSNPVSQSAVAAKGSVEPLSARVGSVVLGALSSNAAVSDASAGPTSIRVVGTPRSLGEKRTLYEVAPGDTVLLAEALAMTLNSVVVTGVGTTTTAQSADTSSTPRIQIRGAKTMSTVPDTQSRKASFSAAPAPSRPPSAETLNGVTTLTWIDHGSGNMMKLSGRHSAAELLVIKGRIEQLRAAETAGKKKP
jgi:hypothetical protein